MKKTWIQKMHDKRNGKVLTNIKFSCKEVKEKWLSEFQNFAATMPDIDNIRFIKNPYGDYSIEIYVPRERNGKVFLFPHVIPFQSKASLLGYVEGYIVGFNIGRRYK